MTQAWRQAIILALGGILSAGLLSGCGGEVTVPVPNLSTAAQKAEEASKEVINKLDQELRKVMDPSAPPQVQFEQLQAKAKELYCKAENSVIAEAIKNLVRGLRDELAKANPEVAIPPLDLEPEMCGK
jgi:DNA repair exonuclease SbcCD ATPase subunit